WATTSALDGARQEIERRHVIRGGRPLFLDEIGIEDIRPEPTSSERVVDQWPPHRCPVQRGVVVPVPLGLSPRNTARRPSRRGPARIGPLAGTLLPFEVLSKGDRKSTRLNSSHL